MIHAHPITSTDFAILDYDAAKYGLEDLARKKREWIASSFAVATALFPEFSIEDKKELHDALEQAICEAVHEIELSLDDKIEDANTVISESERIFERSYDHDKL